jgi:hypothetical protein
MSTVSEPHAKDRDATFPWRAAGSQRCWQGTIFLRQAKFTGHIICSFSQDQGEAIV